VLPPVATNLLLRGLNQDATVVDGRVFIEVLTLTTF